MAKQLKDFKRTTSPGPQSPYPWDKWLHPDSTWRLTRPEDFRCTPQSITDLIRRHARKRDQKVSVYRDGAAVVVVNPKKSGG